MQSTNQPAKTLVPFAQNDSAKVELPPTTTDATRASQSLGFPPLTGMPPEAGGVPPQLEDMNGGLNQIARIPWWLALGGRFGYDGTFVNDPLIAGYPRGAVLPAALGAALIGMGEWYNNVEGNVADPDVAGTGWVPGYHYGATALTGQTGGTVTLTPAQAAKRIITVAGTLTSNLVLVVPGWIYDWTVHNNTGGAFTVTVKNAATPGVVIPQNGAPTPVRCDGATCTLWSPNIAQATQPSQAATFAQTSGRLLNVQTFTANGTYTPTPGAVTYEATVIGGGGGGGGAAVVTAGNVSAGSGGGGGGYATKRGMVSAISGLAIVVGAAGTATAGAAGGNGGASTIGSGGGIVLSAGGGGGGELGSPASGSSPTLRGQSGAGLGTLGDVNAQGGRGGPAFYAATPVGGPGGASQLGPGGGISSGTSSGVAALTPGSGGGGGCIGGVGPGSGAAGGVGAAGIVIIREYS